MKTTFIPEKRLQKLIASTNEMMGFENNPLGIGEVRNSFKYKFADEDAKKSTAHFRKLGNNAAKLDAFKASLERGKSC